MKSSVLLSALVLILTGIFITARAADKMAKDKMKPATSPSAKSDWRNFKKPSKEELKKTLTSQQYKVTQEEDTDYPGNGGYTKNHEEGIYVDIVSGEPLFSSKAKYDSGTGWPSFYEPLVKENVVEKKDADGSRTEVRSKRADSHLGHVFDDGPKPTGLRYCMNSSSLRFVKKADLEKEGYGEFLKLFN